MNSLYNRFTHNPSTINNFHLENAWICPDLIK